MATIMRVGGGAGGGAKAKIVNSLSVGDKISIVEDGIPAVYRIVHKGLPSSMYDASCDGVWVLRETIHSNRMWDATDNDYRNSDIHSWLNGDFLTLFNWKTQENIKQVKIPYHNGVGNSGSVASGVDGLSAKAFLLSGYEVGWTKSTNAGFPEDGACLDYFKGTSTADSKRACYYNGSLADWDLRSPVNSDGSRVWCVTQQGDYSVAYNTNDKGVRPTLLLDPSSEIANEPNSDGSYSLLSDVVPDVYGIARDITASSPEWTRTDSAIGFKAVASIGTVAGASDFDNIYPWSEMKRVTLDSGDVMVRIPKFYYGRYRNGNIERIQISGRADVGLTLHPAFNHAGVEQDCIYVGAYKTSAQYTSYHRSVSGDIPLVSGTRATFRAKAKEKGAGWEIIDISTLSAIQMLYLVEFANNNSQAMIGRGYCDGNSAKINTGSCDVVPNLTGRPAGTDGKTDIIYRGIEGIWGNIWEWVDGANYYAYDFYVCNDPSKYADNTSTGYTLIGTTGGSGWNGKYITEMSLNTNEPHIMVATNAGGSETTGYCDAFWANQSGWRIYGHGGEFTKGSMAGLFTVEMDITATSTSATTGSRLIYIP